MNGGNIMRLGFGIFALVQAITIPAPARADHNLYKQVAPCTVGFYERKENKKEHTVFDGFYGSGVLVDVERKIVVTAEHVVRRLTREGIREVKVMFPQTDDKGNILTEALYYKRRRSRLAIAGTVIYQNRLKDLALVQLERLPEGTRALPLAKLDPKVGDAIHIVGNSTYFGQQTRVPQLGAAFGYSRGNIRNIYFADTQTPDPPTLSAPEPAAGPIVSIHLALLHHGPADHGDSGGAIVNNRGELVGIVSGGLKNRILANPDIHVGEIRRALENIQQPAADVITMKCCADSDADEDTPSMDNFYIPLVKGEEIEVELKGDGRTLLDLYAKDIDTYPKLRDRRGRIERDWKDEPIPDNKLLRLLEKTELTGLGKGLFAPDWNGIGLIQVVNQGDADKKNFRNDYTLQIKRKSKVPGVFTAIRQLTPGGTDVFQIPYLAGKGKARVSIRGDHEMKLELTVLDPAGKVVAKGKGTTDVDEVTWTPAVSGVYAIRVQGKELMNKENRKGPFWSQYILTTD